MHASWVVQPLADYGVPRSWWLWLSLAKAAGAVELLVGLAVPLLGEVAGIALAVLHRGHHDGCAGALVFAHPVPRDVTSAGGGCAGSRIRVLILDS
ncbi:DoxX family protein [Actinocrinis sp.]|uniref:DoxX family protein n=1 Tax=Actinocrinis sp. TaxID=1920516 RepID=UPI0032C219EC